MMASARNLPGKRFRGQEVEGRTAFLAGKPRQFVEHLRRSSELYHL
jgi:hypothetical protein